MLTVASRLLTWPQQNKTIKHNAEINGVYRLSIFSSAKFKILTTYMSRHSTDRFSGIVSIILNSGDEEIFILEASDKKLTASSICWCIDFVAATQLVTV